MLLSKAEWDKEQLIRDLREEWGIVDEEPDEGDEDDENSDDAVVMRVGGMMLIVTLFHGHIPDNEAEINAENNYMWPEAVEVAKAHKAHIVVAVLGEEEKLLERGQLFTKAMAVCCKQKYATGVYTSGVVFEPRFYEGRADMLKEDELPIFNWVWFGPVSYTHLSQVRVLCLRPSLWQTGRHFSGGIDGGVPARCRAGSLSPP